MKLERTPQPKSPYSFVLQHEFAVVYFSDGLVCCELTSLNLGKDGHALRSRKQNLLVCLSNANKSVTAIIIKSGAGDE